MCANNSTRTHRSTLDLSVGGLLILAFTLTAATAAAAIDTNGSLYYTTFSGGQNIHKVDYSWVGGGLSLSGNTALGAGVAGADGILFLPNGNLAVGGQGGVVHEVSLTGSLVADLAVPTASYHLSLSPGGKVLYSSSIPGQPTAITLNASGGLAGAVAFALPTSGTQTQLDTIAWASGGPNAGTALFTSSGAGGGGVVGKIAFAGGPEAPTSAMTSSPTSLTASHGLVYDPFSDSFITMGGNQIARFGSDGTLLETRNFSSSLNFDQGTVDGLGHIFAADNGGFLTLIDYSGGTLAGASFGSLFLAGSLDDIAPKVGSGAISTPDSGTTAAMLGLALLSLVAARRKLA